MYSCCVFYVFVFIVFVLIVVVIFLGILGLLAAVVLTDRVCLKVLGCLFSVVMGFT